MYTDGPFLDKVTLKNTTWVFSCERHLLKDELRSQKLLSRWVGSLQPWAVQALNLNPSELDYRWLMRWWHWPQCDKASRKLILCFSLPGSQRQPERNQRQFERLLLNWSEPGWWCMLDELVEVDIGLRWWRNLFVKTNGTHVFVSWIQDRW